MSKRVHRRLYALEWFTEKIYKYTVLFAETITIVLIIYIVSLGLSYMGVPVSLTVAFYAAWSTITIYYYYYTLEKGKTNKEKSSTKTLKISRITVMVIVVVSIAVWLVPYYFELSIPMFSNTQNFINFLKAITKAFAIMFLVGFIGYVAICLVEDMEVPSSKLLRKIIESLRKLHRK